jgi:NAD(P)-dependent dehydrogenase (short-subunit alcohol dehydrogenase family)
MSQPPNPPVFKTQPWQVTTQSRRYEGRVVIVTGAAQGLGRVIARRVAEEGASVVVCDIQEARVRRTAEKLQAETGQRFIHVCGDLAVAGVAEDMVKRTLDEFGQIDTLVNNAAALIRMRLEDFSEELLQKAVNWNVWNTLRCCKAVLPHMLERGYGRIVNVGGEAWRLGTPFHTLLGGVGKGSMVGLTATLAGDTVRRGITVNCVSPGGMESEADGDSEAASSSPPRDPSWNPPEVMQELMKYAMSSPSGMGRLAHPTEVAAAIAFFGSPEASFVTGQHVGVSGGIAML